jgi:hypothetical protein
MTEEEGVVRPRGSLGEVVVVVEEEDDGSTLLSGDWAVAGSAAITRARNPSALPSELVGMR